MKSLVKELSEQFRGFGEHLCCIYRNKRERNAAVISFLLTGLKNNEKCLYVMPASAREEIVRAFQMACFDVKKYLESKQLEFLPVEEICLKDGYFTDETIMRFKQAEAAAVSEGYNGLRVVTEASQPLPGSVRQMEYEPELNQILQQSRISFMCLYNEKKFPPRDLLDVIYTHPKIIFDGLICDNPSYLPPDDFLSWTKGEITQSVYEKAKRIVLSQVELKRKPRLAGGPMKRREEFFSLLINRMPIGMIVWDRDFKVRHWNPAATKILGFTEEEALGKHPYEFMVPKEVQQHIDDVWRKLLEGDFTAHSVNENITKDGRTIVCEWNNTPLIETDGTVVGVLSMFQDITERQRVEEALRESEEKYRSLVEYTTDSIYLVDRELRYLFVNGELLRRLGLPREKVVGKTFGELHTTEETLEFAAKIKEVFDTGKAVTQVHYSKRLGSFLMRTMCPIKDSDTGEIRAVTVVSKDVTELEDIRQRLAVSEQQLRKVIDSSPDILAVFDTKGNLVDCSQSFLDVSGFSRKEAIGKKFMDFVAVRDREKAREDFERVFKVETLKNVEYWLLSRGGNEFPVELSASVVRGPLDKPMLVVIVARDITERKNFEKRLIETIYRIYDLEKGECYITQSPETGCRLVAQLVLHGVAGLCISRSKPERLLEQGIPRDKIVLLSSTPFNGFETIDDLQEVGIRISEFLKENKESVVFLGGLEYLISRSGFDAVYRFIQEKRFAFMEANANFLVSIDLATLSDRERAMLISEVKVLGK
ncbi:MAG: PAS domain S-box protein [Candidatus Hadarchaeaceae archaeon]